MNEKGSALQGGLTASDVHSKSSRAQVHIVVWKEDTATQSRQEVSPRELHEGGSPLLHCHLMVAWDRPAPAAQAGCSVWLPGGWTLLHGDLGFPHVQITRLIRVFNEFCSLGIFRFHWYPYTD